MAKIAEALYKSTYLESWGSGAKRIMDACREQGVEEPVWRWDGGFVIVTFKRPTIADDPSKPQVRPKYAPSTPQVKQLIMAMADGYNSIRELAEMCGYQDPKHPKQRYRLTTAAREWKTNKSQKY